MSCADIQRKLAEHFDSGLPRTSDLEAHLVACAHCRAYVARLDELDILLSETEVYPPAGLVARVNTAVADQQHSTRMVGVALMLAAGLILTTALSWFLPVVPAAKNYWAQFRGLIPRSDWVAAFPTLESQFDSIRSQVTSYAGQLQSYPGIAVWGALLAVVPLLILLNGIEAVGVDSFGRSRRGDHNRLAK